MKIKVIERSALANYSAEKMYALVHDFEAYPHYMPGCVGAELLESGEDWIKARLDLAMAGLKQSIVTRNTLQAAQAMHIDQVEGPFAHFKGKWSFDTLSPEACKVVFVMEFAFASRILGLAAGKLFEQVASQQVKAICERAKFIYG